MANYSKNVKPTLSLGESLTSVFNKYATFTGRARRSEYWWFALVYGLVCILLNFIQMAFLAQMYSGEISGDNPMYLMFLMFMVVAGLGLFIPGLSVSVRRLHDIGKSGWNLLWGMIPFVGAILLLVWSCQDSDVVANKYGESPKYGKE